MHIKNRETWIAWRTAVNRGWTAEPRHEWPGRHAYTVGREETPRDARLFGAIRAVAVLFGRRARGGAHGVRFARTGA